ncbi:MAG: hypothetical protein J0L99_18955 [Chitinophagales bacterium]|nr:hypothetical protein [Chitinophagales bacterium]
MKRNYRLLALLVLPVLIFVWHCQSKQKKPNMQVEKAVSNADSMRCNLIPTSGDSITLEIIMDNPFTHGNDNFFKCRKDYYSFDSLYIYRYSFVWYVDITCIAYKQKQQWYMDIYYYHDGPPHKPKKFYRSKLVSQGVIDAFQRRLEGLNYRCLPIWLDTIDYFKRKGTSQFCCRNRSSQMAISCSGKQYYFQWGELGADRSYQERDNKAEEQIRSAVAYLISNAGFPKPELYMFASTNNKRDSIGLHHIALMDDLLIDSILQWQTPSPITLRFEEGKDFQRIHKSKAHLLDSISIEVLLYTGERYWLRPPKIHWYY